MKVNMDFPFGGPNPEHEDFFQMVSLEEAQRLLDKLSPAFPPIQ